jgi:hypothetical protein
MPGSQAFEVVMEGEGRVAVVWQERVVDDGTTEVWARTSSAGSGWKEIASLSGDSSHWLRALSASLNAGVGVAVWTGEGADAASGAWTSALWAAPLRLD